MKVKTYIKVIKETERFAKKTGKPFISLSILCEDGNWYSDIASQFNQSWRKGMEVQFEYEMNGNFRNIVWPKKQNNYGRQEQHDSDYGSPQPTPQVSSSARPQGGAGQEILKELAEIKTQIKDLTDIVVAFTQSKPVTNLLGDTRPKISEQERLAILQRQKEELAAKEFNEKASNLPDFDDEEDIPF